MKKELNPKYDSRTIEKNKYQTWIKKGYFEAGDESKKPFCIVIPPPNVTGKLHLGHAWDGTLQDVIIRYKKLKGFDTLWLPGMDHAGIATQAKVEEKLRSQGISRHDLGRDKFLSVTWEWKEEYAAFIRSQWEKLGLALDYRKERFTLDDDLNKAVNEVFIHLYEKGLIYRGERIINWDPVQMTALSNIEVIYKELESQLYFFHYRLVDDESISLVVATTRPETMFADVCLIVNPKDKRYQDWIGRSVINPANGMVIPIIADDYVDIDFATGVMKCTPAHDPNDFILGEKHGLARPVCLEPDGKVNELGHIYKGLDRFECRKKMVEDLRQKGLLSKIEVHINQVGHSERSDAIVEPYLSKQWFVKMKPLAETSLAFQTTEEKVNFFPERFEKIFSNWMEGIEDWCISRQLWWGHRIPAWYHKDTGDIYVGNIPPSDVHNYNQDEDVLDTWFSSALWPFSTLGWPNVESPLYKRYYPTDVLVTGYDIIFFWVSRMIFQSLEFTGNRPFNDCLIHGLIRDEQGRKMSKSLGNGVDPMEVIDTYGADALRYFLTTNSAPGLDLRYIDEKVRAAWNFINKIWNAARFVLMNLPNDFKYSGINRQYMNVTDKWILSRLRETVLKVEEFMDKYEFVIAGNYLYSFIWNDFCSWYVEMAKIGLQSESSEVIKNTQNVLYYVLESILKMIHPFMPFVTEEIYQALRNDVELSIMQETWPEVIGDYFDDSSNPVMQAVIDIITTIRTMRSENNIPPNKPIVIKLQVTNIDLLNGLKDSIRYLERFTFAQSINFCDEISQKEESGIFYAITNVNLFLPLKDLVNIHEEIIRLEKEKKRLESEIERAKNMLNNPAFISKAPESKIDSERQKMLEYISRLERTNKTLLDYKNSITTKKQL